MSGVGRLIRRAQVSDARALAEVHVASRRAAYRGLMPGWLLDEYTVEGRTERFAALLAEPDPPGSENWLIETGEGVRGFVTVGPSRDPGASGEESEVYSLYLAPDAFGMGFGRALMEHAVALARSKGDRTLVLWVLETNERAKGFYGAVGMRLDGGRRVDVVSGVELPHVRYRVGLEG